MKLKVLACSVWLALAGCSGDDGDAAPPDGPPDLVADGEVVVVIGHPVSRGITPVTLVATGAAGAVGEPVSTTSGEEIAVAIEDGGALTVVYELPDGWRAETVREVRDGDRLTTGWRQSAGEDFRPPISVTWPDIGAAHYAAVAACQIVDGSDTGAELSFSQRCEPDDATDVMALAFSAGDVLTSYALAEDVPLGAALDLEWEPARALTLTIGNAQTIDSYEVSARAVVEGTTARTLRLSGSSTPAGETASVTAPWPTAPEIWLNAGVHVIGAESTQITVDRLAGDVATIAVDPLERLPLASDLALVDDEISWSESTGAGYDGAIVTIGWDVASERDARAMSWTVIAPPDQASVTLPGLGEAFAFLHPAGDVELSLELRLQDFVDDDDYDALRARPVWQLTTPSSLGTFEGWTERYRATWLEAVRY